MSELNAKRVAAFQRRFPERTILSFDEVYVEYFARDGLQKTECEEVLTLLASELAIPLGLLRPYDKMADILEPVHSGNPLRWIEEWTRAADGKSELNDRVRRRLSEKGTLNEWAELPTVGDVVRAWCGQQPQSSRPKQRESAEDGFFPYFNASPAVPSFMRQVLKLETSIPNRRNQCEVRHQCFFKDGMWEPLQAYSDDEPWPSAFHDNSLKYRSDPRDLELPKLFGRWAPCRTKAARVRAFQFEGTAMRLCLDQESGHTWGRRAGVIVNDFQLLGRVVDITSAHPAETTRLHVTWTATVG